MHGLLTAGLLLCAATEGIGQRPPATLGLRVLSAHPKDFWLEITNVSAVPIDGPVRLTVRLTRLDDNKGPEYAKYLYTYVDPESGRYRESSPLLEHPRLVLGGGKTKTIRVEYEELQWFYPSIGTRAPELLSDLAESGEFDLSVTLEVESDPWSVARSDPVRVRIRSRRALSILDARSLSPASDAHRTRGSS